MRDLTIPAAIPLAMILCAAPRSTVVESTHLPATAVVGLVDSLKHLLRGPHSGFAFALRVATSDSAAFRRLWAESVQGNPGAPAMPRIDFERRMVIVATMGSRPSTGFSIAIDSVVARGPAVEVHVVLSSAGSLCVQGAAMTNPVDIVEVPKSFAVVVFRDRHVTVECKMP
jgi:protease stability complex PrcB-like protein